MFLIGVQFLPRSFTLSVSSFFCLLSCVIIRHQMAPHTNHADQDMDNDHSMSCVWIHYISIHMRFAFKLRTCLDVCMPLRTVQVGEALGMTESPRRRIPIIVPYDTIYVTYHTAAPKIPNTRLPDNRGEPEIPYRNVPHRGTQKPNTLYCTLRRKTCNFPLHFPQTVAENTPGLCFRAFNPLAGGRGRRAGRRNQARDAHLSHGPQAQREVRNVT